ncbi:MAG: glycosyl hydrolase [Victivallales bacterium]
MTSRKILGLAVLAIVSQLAAVSSSLAAKHLEPLPVTGTAEKPVIILEAEPLDGKEAADPAVSLYGGKVLSHDGKSCDAGDSSVVLSQPGYKSSTVTLSYTLDPKPKAGKYKVWTAFTVGGTGGNKFTISGGKTPDKLSRRLDFAQQNLVSWKVDWQKAAGTLVIFPSDTTLTIEVAGMASDKKILDAFLLEPIELFPADMTEASGDLRASLAGTQEPSKASQRLYVLEGTDVKAMDDMLIGISPETLAGMDVTYLMGGEAQEAAKSIGLKELPSLIMADGAYKILGALGKGSTKPNVERLLKDGAGSAPLPAFPQMTTPAPKAFVGGRPAEWLIAGNWCGPCGISLQGIDVEKTLRPSAGDPCMVMQFDTAKPTQWKAIPLAETGAYVIESPTANYVWPRGTGNAFLYFKVDSETEAILHVAQSGIRTAGWLDGEPLKFGREDKTQAKLTGIPENAAGRTDQGNTFEVKIEGKEGAVAAPLTLSPGWHRLMLKLVMQHKEKETFQFAANLTDKNGNPLQAVGCVVDPETDPALHAAAQRLVPYMYANDPISLPHPGEALKLKVEFRNFPLSTSNGSPIPALPLTAKLVLVMTDYDGNEIARRELGASLPGKLEVDFGPAPKCGYYSIRPTLLSPDGKKIIAVYPPDGFSVIGGTASQEKRKDAKKMSTTYYFLPNNPDKHHRDGVSVKSTFEWMNRMGIYRNVGSSPGFSKGLWDMAQEMGIILSADFWDIHNSETSEQKKALAKETAAYGRWYKSFNEVDIQVKVRGTPENWVNRTKMEYAAVKSARPDGFYVGGSLVRVGAPDQKGWFENCLKLGLDKYQDAWDVHAYPQNPPVLGGSISNSSNETEQGVLNTYKKIGRINTLPFWVGETGARSCHGYDSRRWQAEMVAKMTAWANSRSDTQVISFLIPFSYSRNTPTLEGKIQDAEGDIQAGHQPAEAAYYTASALIDGLPYRKVDCSDSSIQAGYFGDTLMLWTTGTPVDREITIGDGDWLLVDAVGRVTPLQKEASGTVKTHLTTSPAYILDRKSYEKLTAF